MQQLNSKEPNVILVGLGGTGGKVLKAIRKRIFREFPNDADRQALAIGYVYVDSTREMMTPGDPSFKVLGQDASFKESEFVDIKSVDLSSVLSNVKNYPGLAGVVHNGESMQKTLGEVGKAAGQKRRAGRILFAANVQKYLSALKNQYQKVKDITKKDQLTIHIFTGLAGGTGSGSIVDVVAQTRKQELYHDARIIVHAMVPELDIPGGCQAGRYHQNGYAALRELNALNIGAYLPCDVVTGEAHVNLNTDSLKQFTLMLYSNVNENGVVVNSFSELPELLADTVYSLMFLKEESGVNDDIMRALNGENYNDFTVEYSEKSKGYDKERARTKACSTFGIKRIVYPEKRILEHITYTAGKRVLLQMAYNNFNEDLGYLDEAPRKDYRELYITDSNLSNWHLSDAHLQLQKKIFDSDKYIETFEDFWQETAFFDSYETAKEVGGHPLVYVQNSCLDTFNKSFRNKMGVEAYYRTKADSNLLTEMAVGIVEQIEKSLYTQWYEGTLSLYDLQSICDAILEDIDKRYKGIEGLVAKKEEQVKHRTEDVEDNLDRYDHRGLFDKAIGKSKDIYAEHQQLLKKLYVTKTEIVALGFEGRILSRLRQVFTEFHDQVQTFIAKIAKSIEAMENSVADRAKTNSGVKDMHQAIIEVSEDDKMKLFERTLLLDKNKQANMASTIRKALAQDKAYAHFDELANSMDDSTVFDILDTKLSPIIIAEHDQTMAKDKILGMNVLQQLQKVLVDQTAIDNFAREIIEQSGTFLKLDDSQLTKSLNNNPSPVSEPETMNRKCVLVTMPTDEGDENLKQFANRLQTALRDAYGTGTPGSKLQFAVSAERKNEISILSLRYCFPMRAISWLKTFEDEYKRLVENPNETVAAEARILLHSEGDGRQLPGLMGEERMKASDFGAFMFMGAVLNLLSMGEDSNENRGWCYMEEDEWGSQIPHLISERFTGILTSDELSQELMDDITEKINEYFKNPELKRSEREALADGVKKLMRDVVSKEVSSPSSPVYAKHSEYAKKALDMIMKLK